MKFGFGLLGLLLICACQTTHEQKALWATAIEEVLVLRLEARERAVPMSLGPDSSWNPNEFIRGLRDIDTKNCPKEFRSAWKDYVDAKSRGTFVENLITKVGATNELSGVLAFL